MKQAATLFLPLALMIPGLHFSSAVPANAQQPSSSAKEKASAPIAAPIPAESLFQLLAAEMALDREHPEIALANYIAAAKETQDASIASRATQIALTVASLEVALEPAIIWAKSDPKNLEAQITVAALYIRLDETSKAVPYLKNAEKENAEDALQYYLILYRQLQNEKESQRVIQALEELAKTEKSIPSAHLALAEIYLFHGKQELANQMSQEALNIAPKSVNAISLFTETLVKSKGKEAAKTFIDEKLAQNPNNVELREYYAQFLLENEYTDAARKEIETLIENPKLSAEDLLQFARLCIQAQWFDTAKKILLKTKEMPENKDLSHYFLARIAELQNKDDEAIQWFQQVLTGPFHVLSQIRASVMLSDKKQYDEALKVLSHTQPLDMSDKKQILLTGVEILNKAKRYQEAMEELNDNIKILPEDIDLRYARSIVADHLDKLDIAETDLKTILSVQPSHIDALNALGYLLANKTKRFQEAQSYLNQALKLSPNNASVLDSMGWLYFKMGNYKQSLETLQKAAEIMPDAEIAAHLGEVMWHMNDHEGAKRVWNNALEQHPKHENIMRAMRRAMANEKTQ